MLTHVLRNLPPAIHHAWVCSSGSRGYCAVKEMLQNGSPGITLLLENDDLRDVDASSKECCLRIYCYPSTSAIFEHRDHIPSAVRHVTEPPLTGNGGPMGLPQGMYGADFS